MGTRYVLHFDDEKFLGSINKAKWNIYCIALQDLTFYTLSYLNNERDYKNINQAQIIYNSILKKEELNGMPTDVMNIGKTKFEERLSNIDWKTYYSKLPFNESALALYKWAPVSDELKTLDRKIVLNSMILKWDNVKEEFKKLINF